MLDESYRADRLTDGLSQLVDIVDDSSDSALTSPHGVRLAIGPERLRRHHRSPNCRVDDGNGECERVVTGDIEQGLMNRCHRTPVQYDERVGGEISVPNEGVLPSPPAARVDGLNSETVVAVEVWYRQPVGDERTPV